MTNIARRSVLFGTCAAFLLGMPGVAHSYPDKTVRIVVGYAPGGGVDAVARLIADKLSAKWGKPVIVQNRPGASGTVAEADIAQAEPDGHSMVLVSNAFVVVPNLMKLAYTPSDFAPISQLTQSPDLLVINPKYLKVSSTQELIDYAKANPGKLSFGGSGVGSSNALSMQIFNSRLGLNMVQVNYAGTAEIVTALLGGEIQVAFGSRSGFGGQIDAGAVKVLAVSSRARLPSMLAIPTVAESANLPGYEEGQWLGILTRAGTPKEIVDKLQADIVEVLQKPDAQEQLVRRGYIFVGSNPAEFSAVVKKQVAHYAEVLKNLAAK